MKKTIIEVMRCWNCGHRWFGEHNKDYCPSCKSTNIKVSDENAKRISNQIVNNKRS